MGWSEDSSSGRQRSWTNHRPCDWNFSDLVWSLRHGLGSTLEIDDGSGNTIATNDDWKEAQQVQIEATGLPPADDHEAAILATRPVGGHCDYSARANK